MLEGKIIATVGISGSGKTTWAHEEWKKDPLNKVIIERDNIRNLLFGYNDKSIKEYYQRKDLNKLEKEVTKYQNTLIYDSLEQGKTVLLSNTHLNRKRDLESLKYWNVETKIKLFPVTLKEALTRDMSRTRQVGKDIITKQYSRFVNLYKDLENNPVDFTPLTIKNSTTREKCILIDLDGTLCDMVGKRSPYDWKKVGGDLADYSVKKLVQNIDTRNVEIIICTGRDGSCLRETTDWLADNGVFYRDIFIRAENDNRPDWVVKEEMWREIVENYFILGLIDDRLQVVRRARALGLKVFNVEHNNF